MLLKLSKNKLVFVVADVLVFMKTTITVTLTFAFTRKVVP